MSGHYYMHPTSQRYHPSTTCHLLAARVCSDWFSTTSSLFTENPLSIEACPCDKSNASSQTDHALGQLAAILLRRNVSRRSSATQKFSNSPFAQVWMMSSNCCTTSSRSAQQQNRLQHTLTTKASSLSYTALENQPCYKDPSRTMLQLSG